MKFTRLLFVLLVGNYCKAPEQGKTTVQDKSSKKRAHSPEKPGNKLALSNSLELMIQEACKSNSEYKHPFSKKLTNPIEFPSKENITCLLEIAYKTDEKMGIYLLTLIRTVEQLAPSDLAYQFFDLLSKFDNTTALAFARYLSHSNLLRHTLENGLHMPFVNVVAQMEAGAPLNTLITESGDLAIKVIKKNFYEANAASVNTFLNETSKWIESNAFFQDKKFSKDVVESMRSIITEPTRVQTLIEIRPYLDLIINGFTMQRVNEALNATAQLAPGQEAVIASFKTFADLYQKELVALETVLATKPRA